MSIRIFTTCLLLSFGLFALNGCTKQPAGETAHEEAGHDEHDHDEEGPHGGHIIEIGADDHHVELTHDEATHKVGVYLLGGDAKTATPIETAEPVVINVAEDGTSNQYVLPPVPQTGEAEGRSSYFEIVSEPLCKVVCGESEAKNTQARVSLKIGGKPFVGMIETAPHDHDHHHDH